MKRNILSIALVLPLVQTLTARADCTGCPGELDQTLTKPDIWGTPSVPDKSEHTHDFRAVCDAANLAGYGGEVNITVRVVADLEGATKYVTANFISGANVTPITSANGFINAPANGKFFENDGVHGCEGDVNSATVLMDYDAYNAMLAAGGGTAKIQIKVSGAVEDLCDRCCDTGQNWTPDACCVAFPPCSCPPAVKSYSEVALLYMDCNVFGEPFECAVGADCNDLRYCSGTETCVDGECFSTGNPCQAIKKICVEATQTCRDCTSDTECKKQEGQFCNGAETCVSGSCQGASGGPCAQGEECDEASNLCVPLPDCVP